MRYRTGAVIDRFFAIHNPIEYFPSLNFKTTMCLSKKYRFLNSRCKVRSGSIKELCIRMMFEDMHWVSSRSFYNKKNNICSSCCKMILKRPNTYHNKSQDSIRLEISHSFNYCKIVNCNYYNSQSCNNWRNDLYLKKLNI